MERGENWGWPPTGAPLCCTQRDDHWTHFDSTVNAVSFGFVATAVLISMFLAMAIFERFLRPTSPPSSPSGRRYRRDVESQMGFNGKPHLPSPKIPTNAREVSVLMPGDGIPTFIAHPAPVPCPPERIPWSVHQQILLPSIIQQFSNNSDASSSSV